MQTRSDLEDALRAAALGAWAQRLAELARPTIVLVPGLINEGAGSRIGESRLGGAPDLPEGVEWPRRPPLDLAINKTPASMPGGVLLGPYHWLHRLVRSQRWRDARRNWQDELDAEAYIRGRAWPLSFVAQIDFAQLNAVEALDGLPAAGRLLLFCDPFDLPWGRAEHQTRARVLFLEEPVHRLERMPFPDEFGEPQAQILMPRGYAFKPRRLQPTAWLLPPPLGSAAVRHLALEAPDAWGPDGDAMAAYETFWIDLGARSPDVFGGQAEAIHQVGGVAVPIQEPVEEAAALFAGDDPTAAERWRLVLQIDSDVAAGMEWGDSGRLYLTLREADLAARHLDRAWVMLQCF